MVVTYTRDATGKTVPVNPATTVQATSTEKAPPMGSYNNPFPNTTDKYIAPDSMPGYAGTKRLVLNPNYKPTSNIAITDLQNSPNTNPIPTIPQDTTNYSSILQGIQSGALTGGDAIKTITDNSQSKQGDLLKSLIESIGTPPNTADLYKQAQQETDILNKRQKVNDLTGQLNTITANAQANQLAVTGQGRGIPEAIIGGQQAQIAKEAAIAALPVSAQLNAAQGNLQMAEQNLNTLFQIKSADAQAQYSYKKELVKTVYDFASKQEQNKLDLALKLEDRKYQEGQKDKEILKSIALEAVKNGASATTIGNITSAKDVGSAIKFAGSSLSAGNNEVVKIGDNAVLINKTTGKIIKTYGDNTGSNTGTINTIFNPLISTVSNLETTVAGKKAVKDQMSGFIKNQDYKSAYNQVANTVANSLSGETKSRFENARVDKEVLAGLRTSIQQFGDAGGNLGLLKGSVESIERKLGSVSDPALTSLAVQLQREFQSYRQAMTGAAFTNKESREYASVNPTSGKSLDLNISVIDGAIAQLSNRVDGTIRAKVPQATDLLDILNKQYKPSVFSQAVKSSTSSVFDNVNGWIIPTN